MCKNKDIKLIKKYGKYEKKISNKISNKIKNLYL